MKKPGMLIMRLIVTSLRK